ncbi:YceI family protein [Algimonas porphyrae]|nr:YceI family protein [Algimonas porphyrae]
MKQLIAPIALIATLPILAACAAESPPQARVEADVTPAATAVASEVETASAFDFSALPSGTYTDENGHAYIHFSYDHQGYSRPILRWGEFDATVEYDSETPENSTLNVTIPVESIDSMVPAFNDHLKSADFFDVATYPTITFRSTALNINPDGSGTITGDLTMKDVTREITFDGQLNKIGQHLRSGKDMFGISGTGTLMRSDYDLGRFAPNVGDEVTLMIEVEFQKAD